MIDLASTGTFGRVMAWLAGLGLLAGALAYVPSPLGLLHAFEVPPVPEVRPVPALTLRSLPAIETYEALWARPLFNPDRVPDPQAAPNVPTATGPATGPRLADPGQFRLVGIAGDSETRLALVRKEDGSIITLKIGDSLGGWSVERIDERGVSIRGGGRKQILAIPRAPNAGKTP
jgi:general secretion pathway protein N